MFVATISVNAQTSPDSSNSGLVKTENDVVIKESIKERIEQAVKKTQDNETASPQALVGVLESITAQSLNLEINGLTELLSISEETSIVDEDNEALEVEDLEIGGGIIALVSDSSSGLITAKQIIAVSDLPAKSTKKTTISTIVRVDGISEELEVTTKPNQENFTFIPNKATLLSDSKTGEEIDFDDLQSGDEILTIHEPDDDDFVLLKLERLSAKTTATESANLEE